MSVNGRLQMSDLDSIFCMDIVNLSCNQVENSTMGSVVQVLAITLLSS